MASEIAVKGRISLGDIALMAQMAADGLGLAFVFEDHVRADIAAGRLVPVLEDWCPEFPGFMLYYPRQRRVSAALRAFIDIARKQLR